MTERSDQVTGWHSLDSEETLLRVDSSEDGLSQAEADRRLATHGANQLPAGKRRGPLARLATQFNNLLIQVLIGAAVVTALLGHWIDTGVILGVVVVNAVIGFVQEGRA